MLRRVALAVLAAQLLVLPAVPSPAAAEETVTDRASVIDGQTIRLRDVAVVLWGVIGPKPGERGAAEAALGLYKLVDSRIVTCHLTGIVLDEGRRQLGKCESVGLDLGAVLVSQGYARDCPSQSGGRYRIQEERARATPKLPAGWEPPAHCRAAAAHRKP